MADTSRRGRDDSADTGAQQRYAVLLRGVNVGGHRRVPSADLRALLAEVGGDPATWLASGNGLVTTDLGADDLAEAVRDLLSQRLGVQTDVLVRTGTELAEVVAVNPFPDSGGTRLHVSFCTTAPGRSDLGDLDHDAWLPDRFAVVGREVFLAYDEGAGRSRMSSLRIPGTGPSTARNWNTVLALLDRTGAAGGQD